MSDTRRRRKSEQSGGSDHSETVEEIAPINKETQSTEPVEEPEHRDSEYDTAGSDGESENGSQDGVQRESGDGQEEDKPPKKLDDDEDRRNPQYIPKRGTFYEHDDRTAEEANEGPVEPPNERESKEKKVWKDKEDRWDHDRYNDEEQAPKSHEELIAVYGYDIRNEEGPPRARRRRRYGRGPNKYTRNWEDEDAYGKTSGNTPTGKQNRRSNRSGEDFPALKGSKDAPETPEEPVISSAWYSTKNKLGNKQQNFPPLQTQQDNQRIKSPVAHNVHTNENKAPNEPTNPAWKKDAKYTTQSLSPTRNTQNAEAEKIVHVKQNHGNKRYVQESVSLAASRARGRGFKPSGGGGGNNNSIIPNRTVETKGPKGRGGGGIIGNDNLRRHNTSIDEEQIVNDMKHMNVNDGSNYHHQGRPTKNFYAPPANQHRPNVPQPRMQPPPGQQPPQQQQTHPQPLPDVAGNRPKRYSSLRQRPTIPEGPGQQTYPQQHSQHQFYPPQAGNSHGVVESPAYPQGHFEQPPAVQTSSATMGGQTVIPLAPGGQPATYAPPPFLVPPPQFIPPQTAPPSIINYVPGPNGPPFQPNFQGYQGYNPTVQPQVPPPPPELFQPQGCTYYNPAQQPPQQPQAPPIRRPKAAIPILPPPENNQHQSTRGRGRSITQQMQNNIQPDNMQTYENEKRINTSELINSKVSEIYENAQSDSTDNSKDITVTDCNKTELIITEDKEINENLNINMKNTDNCILKETDNSSSSIDDIDDNNSKKIEINDVNIGDNEIKKVDNVVHENPVVEEAAA